MIGDRQACQSVDDATARLFGRSFPGGQSRSSSTAEMGWRGQGENPASKTRTLARQFSAIETQAALADPGFTDDANHAATPRVHLADRERGRLSFYQ